MCVNVAERSKLNRRCATVRAPLKSANIAIPCSKCSTESKLYDSMRDKWWKERKQTTPTAYHLAMARSEKKYSAHGHMAYGHETGNKSHLGRILLLVLARIQSIEISNMLPFFKILWIVISTFNNQRARPMCVRSRHFAHSVLQWVRQQPVKEFMSRKIGAFQRNIEITYISFLFATKGSVRTPDM